MQLGERAQGVSRARLTEHPQRRSGPSYEGCCCQAIRPDLNTRFLSLRQVQKSRARGARVKTAPAASRARGVLTRVSTLVCSPARSDQSLIRGPAAVLP